MNRKEATHPPEERPRWEIEHGRFTRLCIFHPAQILYPSTCINLVLQNGLHVWLDDCPSTWCTGTLVVLTFNSSQNNCEIDIGAIIGGLVRNCSSGFSTVGLVPLALCRLLPYSVR